MIVVSDTSPILNLGRIGRLELLPALYKRVLIPPAVYDELIALKTDVLLPFEFATASWIVLASPDDRVRVQQLRRDLDLGEAEAIVLAIEHRADLLLVDERRGRRIAASFGLPMSGLLGVLAEAKRAGLIERVKPVLDELIRKARFWIGPELYRGVLSDVDEG